MDNQATRTEAPGAVSQLTETPGGAAPDGVLCDSRISPLRGSMDPLADGHCLDAKSLTGAVLSRAREIFAESRAAVEAIAAGLESELQQTWKLLTPSRLSLAVLFSYYDDPRLFAAEELPDFLLPGAPRERLQADCENALRMKVKQIKALFSGYEELFDWRIVISDNTANKGAPALQSPELLRQKLLGEEEALRPDQLVVCRVPRGESYLAGGRSCTVTKGGAIRYAIRQVLDNPALASDVVIMTDTDLTTNLYQIGNLLRCLYLHGNANHAAATGTRVPSLGAVAVPEIKPHEDVISKTSGLLKQFLLGPLLRQPIADLERRRSGTLPCEGLFEIEQLPKLSDTQVGFKAFKTDLLLQIRDGMHDGGMAFDTELLMLALRAGSRIGVTSMVWCDSEASLMTSATRWEMLRDWLAQYERRRENWEGVGLITSDPPTLAPGRIKLIQGFCEEGLAGAQRRESFVTQVGRWLDLLLLVDRWMIDDLRAQLAGAADSQGLSQQKALEIAGQRADLEAASAKLVKQFVNWDLVDEIAGYIPRLARLAHEARFAV